MLRGNSGYICLLITPRLMDAVMVDKLLEKGQRRSSSNTWLFAKTRYISFGTRLNCHPLLFEHCAQCVPIQVVVSCHSCRLSCRPRHHQARLPLSRRLASSGLRRNGWRQLSSVPSAASDLPSSPPCQSCGGRRVWSRPRTRRCGWPVMTSPTRDTGSGRRGLWNPGLPSSTVVDPWIHGTLPGRRGRHTRLMTRTVCSCTRTDSLMIESVTMTSMCSVMMALTNI